MQRRVLGQRNAESHQAEVGEYMRPFMPFQHRDFYAALPYLFVAYVDSEGYPWATAVSHHQDAVFQSYDSSIASRGEEASSLFDAKGSRFGLLLAGFHPGERSFHQLRAKAAETGAQIAVGVLGLDLSNRRRNRVNGRIEAQPVAGGLLLGHVDSSFGNCPKYIQKRPWRVLDAAFATSSDRTAAQQSSTEWQLPQGTDSPLLQAFLKVVAQADTMFVATAHPTVSGTPNQAKSFARGVDVSHRGGPTGFVEARQYQEEGEEREEKEGGEIDASIAKGQRLVLRWADYVGNAFFNTLGNMIINPKVGLSFPDFETGDLWQAVGQARVNFSDKSLPGAERTVSFDVLQIRHLPRAFAVSFQPAPSEFSPFLPSVAAEEPLNCLSVRQLTVDTHTFTLALPRPRRYVPGQYGVFAVRLPEGEVVQRVWTISSTPQNGPYGEESLSITVKQKAGGRVTPHLASWLQARPRTLSLLGQFQGHFSIFIDPLTSSIGLPVFLQKHVLFVAGGSGITPIISQLRMMFDLHDQFPHLNASLLTYFRSPSDTLFARELETMQTNWPKFLWLQAFTQPSVDSSLEGPHPALTTSADAGSASTSVSPPAVHLEGRPKAAHLLAVQAAVAATPELVMVCGPEGLMATVAQLVSELWPKANLKRESFAF